MAKKKAKKKPAKKKAKKRAPAKKRSKSKKRVTRTTAQRVVAKANAAVSVCRHLGDAIASVEKAEKDLRTMGVTDRHKRHAALARQMLKKLITNCVVG